MRPAPRRLRAVLLDWDGTIVDSAEASFRCYVRLFDSYRIPFDRERFQRTYSPDWYRTYEALGLPRECWAEADARWLGFYAGEENVILGGAREALKRLDEAGIRLGLVTSGTRSRVLSSRASRKAATASCRYGVPSRRRFASVLPKLVSARPRLF